MIKLKEGTYDYDIRRTMYGYNGYPDQYSVIEGQDHDFETEMSEMNENNTNESWGQIPFIMY